MRPTASATPSAPPRSASARGPIVVGAGSIELNEAGCGALANADTTKSGCGQGLADHAA
jgi:hypothetical protein